VADLDLDRLPPSAAPDPRLGVDSRAQPHLAPPALPTSSAGAEEALYVLFATQPPIVVAESLRAWLERAPSEVALTLRKQGGSLALRELLLQASSKDPLAVPARLLARLSDGAKDDLAEEILLATRLLITTVATKTPRRGESEALEALAAAAEPEDRLWLSGPTWLQAASREVCRRGKALAAYSSKLDRHARSEMLDGLLWGQPGEIVADIMDVLWKDASEEVRDDLARMLPDMMEMAEEDSQRMMLGSQSFADMATVDRIALAASKADPNLPFLGAGGLSLWRRFGLRLLPYFAELLPYALSQTSQPSQRFEIVQAYVGNRADITAWLEVIGELSLGDSTMLPSLIAETCRAMIERFRTDRIALARAIDRIAKLDVPLGLLKNVAHAYQRAVLADGAEPTAEDQRAQAVLSLMFGDRPKRSPGKGRAKRRKKAPRKTNPRSGPGQLELPLDENDA
jgi:hypothetical protein